MWIIPKNYEHSVFALDMVESKEDLSSLESSLTSSLMWRSKPSPLRTWLQRWNKESWVQALFGRTLKPSQWSRFEAELTSSLAAIPANHSAAQVNEQEKMIQDTCGLTSQTSSSQLDLLNVSSRTSKATSASDCEKSLEAWKTLVTQRRGEYSARLKLAHRTRESESISWRTPSVQEPGITVQRLQTKDGGKPQLGQRLYDKETGRNCQYGLTQQVQIAEQKWHMPTPTTAPEAPNKSANTTGPKNLLEIAKGDWDHLWPTPRACSAMVSLITPENSWAQGRFPNLETVVGQRTWPTPAANKITKSGLLLNQKGEKWIGVGKPHSATTGKPVQTALTDAVSTDGASGHLNPEWVEWLMGAPIGWTGLDYWGTE